MSGDKRQEMTQRRGNETVKARVSKGKGRKGHLSDQEASVHERLGGRQRSLH